MATIGDTTRPAFAYDSATDTWIPVGVGPHAHTPAAIGAISNELVNAKGDLITATANDLPAVLGVGANDTLLVADSAETTGLKWAGGWTTWTPTVNFTVGNGSTVARYQQVGKTINGYFKITWGSTSAFTGQLSFTLPATPKTGNLAWLGTANDFGTGSYGWIGAYFSGTTVFGYGATTSTSALSYGTLDALNPFTWVSGDSLLIQFSYEVA
jgi:hypothetical protein